MTAPDTPDAQQPKTLDPHVAPYGTWPSPLSAADLATASASYADLVVDGDAVWWLQGDPARGGRSSVVQHTDAGPREVSPEGFNARTRVHEYGGGALGVGHGMVLACSWEDQRVHRITDGVATPVTPAPTTPAGIRWAGMQVLPGAAAFVAVRETHGPDRPRPNPNSNGDEEAVNEIVAVSLRDGTMQVLVTGPDFVAGPWPSPDADRLAWLQWDHPDMPWDSAALWVADLRTDDDGVPTGLTDPVRVAGGRTDGGVTAVCDVMWDGDDLLLSVDPSGWWNVHRWDGRSPAPLHTEEMEAGFPRWVHGTSGLAVLDGTVHVVAGGAVRRLQEGAAAPVRTPGLSSFASLAATPSALVAIAGGPATPTGVVTISPTGGVQLLSGPVDDPAAAVGAMPRPITFPTGDGATAHGLHYPPTSATHVGPPDDAPPLVVLTHGGPTSAARRTLNATAQYWASRGFAVVDVDYRGSTGHGRAYREALQGQWGRHDVTDCIAAARHLAAEGHADIDRVVIEGGSAGGYTTLLALCTTDAFAAGGSSYGVSDLRALATDTHKFESRYLDGLIGRWPEDAQTYLDRSPISHIESLRTPMIVLQGDEDAVVPPAQAEVIVAALRDKGIAHAYLLFEGEQHGFRKAPNIARALEARLAFYGRVLGFVPADDIDLPEFVPGT